MKKSSTVKLPWFLRNPQAAPLPAPAPLPLQWPHSITTSPVHPACAKGCLDPPLGACSAWQYHSCTIVTDTEREQSPDPAWELASPQLALLALHQALSGWGVMQPCTKGLGPIPSLTATQTAGLACCKDGRMGARTPTSKVPRKPAAHPPVPAGPRGPSPAQLQPKKGAVEPRATTQSRRLSTPGKDQETTSNQRTWKIIP